MCSAESLREFVVERLAAAAEDIFVVFKKMIAEYELDRQCRGLDNVWKPQINDVPLKHQCEEEDVLVDQQLCNQERNSSPDQEEPEPPQIKEEQQEHCSSQEGEQLVLKQETDISMLTLTHEERNHSEAQLLNEHQPISNNSHDAEDQDPEGSEHINKGLTSAQDKFVVLKNTNVEYEGEIDRKSRLLDIVWKPHIYLHRIDVPQQHVSEEEEEEVLVDQQLCNQERNSSPDQEDPEPPQIKEEQQEHCSSQEGEQLVLKQETDTSMLTLTHEERNHSEAQLLNEHQPISNNSHDAEDQDPEGSELGDSESTRKSEPKKKLPKRSHNTKTSETDFKHKDSDSRRKSKRRFSCMSTGEKTHSCKTCGKIFCQRSNLNRHIKIHLNQKRFTCSTCGKPLRSQGELTSHMRSHTGERPFSCSTCGKSFYWQYTLTRHIQIHSNQKRFTCSTCGKPLRSQGELTIHMRSHTGERPFSCSICGKRFPRMSNLNRHKMIHTAR